MDKTQDPLWSQLHSPPLRRKGMTDELRLRIESAIADLEQGKRKRFNWFRWLSLCSVAVVTLILAIIFVDLPGTMELTYTDSVPNSEQASNMVMKEKKSEAPIRTGLLIGLRDKSNDYRTLWIAPEHNQLMLKEDGRGLLVPYKLDFWKLETAQMETDVASKRITARIASADKPALATPAVAYLAESILSETIEFAGQQYIAMQLETATQHISLVTTLSEISKGRITPLPLSQLINEQSEEAAEQYDWVIKREQGEWQVFIKGRGTNKDLSISKKAVVHEGKCENWGEIQAIDPAAIDAICSPKMDMIAVFTATDIHIYPYDEGIVEERRLTVPLKQEEKLVMAEWATDEYVTKWSEMTAQILR